MKKTYTPQEVERIRREWKEERGRRGLSQAEAGDLIGIDQKTISQWETTSTPRDPKLQRIAKQVAEWKADNRTRAQRVNELPSHYPDELRSLLNHMTRDLEILRDFLLEPIDDRKKLVVLTAKLKSMLHTVAAVGNGENEPPQRLTTK